MNTWFESGHVAIVTGGTRGLGRALARELLAHGVRTVIDGRDAVVLAEALAELSSLGEVVGLVGDVADDDHVHALVEAAQRFGRLDLLVNNASTLGAVPLPTIEELGSETLRRIFEVNLFAPIHLARHALRVMRRSESGTIVNVTSDAAVEAYAAWGGYGASKAALEQISRILAQELVGSGVRVLVADPGEMRTQMHRAALPDADASTLRDPADAARALMRAIAEMRAPFERVRLSETAIA